MDRKKDLEKYIEEYRAERLRLKNDKLVQLIAELEPVFCEKLNFLIKDQLIKVRQCPGDLEIFYLSCLQSSGHTESYDSIAGISNAQLFLDNNKSQAYWCPKQIYKDMDYDMKDMEKRLRKKIVRLEQYELLYLKQLLIMDDWEVLQQCFCELIHKHLELLIESPLDFQPELKVMCGNYMDRLQLKQSFKIEQNIDEEETVS